MEFFNERGSKQNQNTPEYHYSDDSKIQHLALLYRLDFKIGEDKKKYEKIIDAEGFFNDVAGEKFQRFLFPKSEIDADIHQQRKHNPKDAPDNCLSNGHGSY
jgi:hypothetical protein